MSRPKDEQLFVTRTFMPDLQEYVACVQQIFETHQLTNNGVFSRKLEHQLEKLLNVPYVACCANGTLALQLGLHAAELAGKEVITTPFSYVATVSALMWEGCKVVFADIDEDTCCLDPKSVSTKLSADTAGILPVHIYGNACDVEAFDTLSKDKNILVMYDASQAFGSSLYEKSLFAYGDLTTCSMHATKVFHAAEGGFIASHNKNMHDNLGLLRACGHCEDEHIRLGINAKLSELHAAMGCCMLDKFRLNISMRKKVSAYYDAHLPQKGLRKPKLHQGLQYNYAYYPVIFDDEKSMAKVLARLKNEKIFPRRYCYPALNTLPYLPEKQACPIAESIAKRVLSLPLYSQMDEQDVERIAGIIKNTV